MRILIISDIHLSHHFEPHKYAFLSNLIKNADKVIINGDFWEGYSISFNDFITSKWSALFPLLKEKHTVYLYGNHDKEDLVTDKEQLSLFSDIQTDRFELNQEDTTYIFEHGNRIVPLEGDFPILPFWLYLLAERLVILFGGSLYQKVLTNNFKMKKELKKELKKNEFFISGHTHHQEIDTKARYANSGVIKYGLAQWLLLDDKGLHAKEERY